MNLRRLIVALLLTVAAVVGIASPASAHASLKTSDPLAGSLLETSPTQITLTFSEPVDVVPGGLRLVASDGSDVKLGALAQDGNDTLTASVPALDDGTYVVAWKAVSADSHPINGALTFSVGEESATAPGLIENLVEGNSSSDPAPQAFLAVGRWLSYAGLAILIGGAATLLVCSTRGIQSRRSRTMLLSAASAVTAGTIVMIGAQASLTAGTTFSFQAWQSVIDGNSGRWWASRIPLVAISTVLIARRRDTDVRWWRIIAAANAIALFAVFAAGGHAISGRMTVGGYLSTVIHLAAMSLWAGGLVTLAVIVRREALWTVASKFSALALGSVVLLAGTGIFNGWRQLGTLSGFTETTYGRWLLVKLTLVVFVLTIAAASRRELRTMNPVDASNGDAPLVGVGAALNPSDDATKTALRRTVLCEIGGIALIIAATAGLVNAAPPQVARTGPASISVVQGDRIAQVILDPAVTGGTVMHVYVSNASGALDRPDEITVDATLAAQDIGPLEIPVIRAGPDHVTTNEANLPVAGLWTFTVTARYGDFDQVVFTAQLDIP